MSEKQKSEGQNHEGKGLRTILTCFEQKEPCRRVPKITKKNNGHVGETDQTTAFEIY